MSKMDIGAEIYRIRRQYPELWNFMEAYWNQCYDWHYSVIEEAVKDFAQGSPDHLTRNLLDQTRRAQKDETLRSIMDDHLALAWNGMALDDDDFRRIITELEPHVRELGPAIVPLPRA